jgi:thioredoxin-like negative regulator of GroEL
MPTLLRIFTHPACTGCTEAVQLAWSLQESLPGRFALRTVNLEHKDGLAEAHREHITTIPTLIVSVDGDERERIVGVPDPARLKAAVETTL